MGWTGTGWSHVSHELGCDQSRLEQVWACSRDPAALLSLQMPIGRVCRGFELRWSFQEGVLIELSPERHPGFGFRLGTSFFKKNYSLGFEATFGGIQRLLTLMLESGAGYRAMLRIESWHLPYTLTLWATCFHSTGLEINLWFCL